jgi:hypothetical protein
MNIPIAEEHRTRPIVRARRVEFISFNIIMGLAGCGMISVILGKGKGNVKENELGAKRWTCVFQEQNQSQKHPKRVRFDSGEM